MKRRLLAVLIALTALMCVLLLPISAESTTTRAGYGQVKITPEENGLPLGGYSTADRNMEGMESELYASCIAVTDVNDTTALFLSVDTLNASQLWTNDAKTAIVQALGSSVIDADRIYISATGTMSAPELVYSGTDDTLKAKVDAYRQTVIDACATAAQNAMTDSSPVTIYHNDMDASEAAVHLDATAEGTLRTRLNYNAHYNIISDTVETETYVAGAAFGPTELINMTGYTVTEVADPNDTMGLLKLVPTDENKTPIIMANWSAKANLSSTGYFQYGKDNYKKASSDYVGYFRDAMTGYRVAFFQGTSGNVNAFSLDMDQQNPDVVDAAYSYTDENGQEKTVSVVSPKLYGEKLAQLALHGVTTEEDTLHEAIQDAPIRNMKARFAVKPDVPSAQEVALVNKLKQTDASSISTGDELDDTETVYPNLYEYLVASTENFEAGTAYVTTENGFSAEEVEAANSLKAVAQLTGINARMRHTVNANSTNFATDAVYCDTTVLQFGKMTFVMAPVELYDNYGDTDNNWSKVGAHFVLGNTNGASGYMPNAASFQYNKDSDTYYQGTNITQSTIFPNGAGELLMEAYINVKKTMTAEVEGAEGYDENNAIRLQCECGGKAVGKTGHACEEKEFLPWHDPDSLPVDGNYYLMTDVTLYQEARTGTGKKCIDLNGHTITRKVLPEVVLDITGDEVPAAHYYIATRLFALESNARLTVTDTAGGGKLTRDISALDDYGTDENAKISNYGLLVALVGGNKGEFILYNGVLDAAGQYTGGGGCVANMSADATFTMYNGELLGGISDRGTAVYANGTNNFYGGTLTAGQVLDTAGDSDEIAQNNGTVYAVTDKLLLAGNTTVTGGTDAQGKANNISLEGKYLTVAADYEGSAGITVRNFGDPNGFIIGARGDVTDETLAAHLTADYSDEYCVTTCEDVIMVAKLRNQCVCGGKAAGEHDHTCEPVDFKPWPAAYNKVLPTYNVGGNYYLLTDITLSAQKSIQAKMHLDLNGHTVTRLVDTTEENWAESTRVFYVAKGGTFTITDSTETVGTVTRDLTNLTDEQKNAITNYGLIIMINEQADGDCVLYDGILDATGQVSGGGACVANLNQSVFFRMYGGKLLGGKSDKTGCLHSQGPVELHGGEITGGVGMAAGVGGVNIVGDNGHLYLCGNTQITGNTDAAGNPSNIRIEKGADHFTVVGPYTGTAGVILAEKPYDNMKVAISDNADISGATFTADNYSGVKFGVEDGYVVVDMTALAAFVTYEDQTPVSYHETLQAAFDACPGGKATVTMIKDVTEDTLSISRNTYLNLAGFDVANNTFTPGEYTLYVFDTETDDYTVEDGKGYGVVTGDIATKARGLELDKEIVGFAKPMDHYLKVTEDNGTSFHRLNLRMVGITLNTDYHGLYYKAQFGGDEVVKQNMECYGVALNVNTVPDFRDKTYTAFAPETWACGTDDSGNSPNAGTSMALRGIVKTTNTYFINDRNANLKVFGQAYVRYNGENVRGPVVTYSLRDVFQGTETLCGVEGGWNTLSDAEKASAVEMFNTYSQLMWNWDIPTVLDAAGFVKPAPPVQTQPTESTPVE